MEAPNQDEFEKLEIAAQLWNRNRLVMLSPLHAQDLPACD